jgi:hypothetical protein
MPRKSQNIPANEKEDARFIRVVNGRVNAILQQLKQLGTLGNPKLYKSSKEQRDQINTALSAALNRSMDTLNKGGEVVPEFKLK